jgi:hypothetical protein
VDPAGAHRQQDPRHGVAGRQAAREGQPARPGLAYNVKALRDQKQQLAQQAEPNYARFVDRWRTRPPKGEARERLNPARNE